MPSLPPNAAGPKLRVLSAPVDKAKEEVKRKVKAGEYVIDYDALARGLLEQVFDPRRPS